MKPLPYPVCHHLTAAVAFALFTPTAFAEPAETPGDKLPTVTVTAEHREENLQKTPLAISAFDERTLQDAQINNVRDLSGRVRNPTLDRQSISYSAQP
ncbi:hypothetical protein R0J88_19060, partial [Pseudoalteromonas sp. SIMBA_162]